MRVFEGYAESYDVLYQEKDYEAECDFLETAFRRFSQSPVRGVLDLGCGTGGHLLPLAKRGYAPLAGVDRSETMLKAARRKTEDLGASVDLRHDDIRSVRFGKQFDAVICMFAVMCYQTTNPDVEATVQTARAHLEIGGVFVFDGWFGPGLLTDPPVPRLKRVKYATDEEIIRLACPSDVDVVRHTVDVNYTLMRLKEDRLLETVEETHTMRFFFAQEIKYLLEKNGFELAHVCPFMEIDRPLGSRDWQMAVFGRAV